MKAKLLITALVLLLVSCSSKRHIEKALHSGNYDQAIEVALNRLENNKDKERKQDFVRMLEDAYYKAVARDLKAIDHLRRDGNPENYRAIYETYLDMNARQEAIKPILPLQLNGTPLDLELRDYGHDIVLARNDLAAHLYGKGLALLDSDDKRDLREAFALFDDIEQIYPNYKDTRNLMEDAHNRGTDYVIVHLENQTDQIMPQRLEEDLLAFDTYGLDQFWTVYHASIAEGITYDYAMDLQLQHIHISAEELHELQSLREKQIVDGWEYQLDAAGNVVKDSLGNDIKIDRIINVRARYFEFRQFKSVQLVANVVYTDLKHGQTLNAFPIDSQFVFENRYATVRGDERALNRHDLALLSNRHVFFPSDAQMVYDSGENLKTKLKNLISSYRIRA